MESTTKEAILGATWVKGQNQGILTGQFEAEIQSSGTSEAGSAGFPCRPRHAPLQVPGPAPVGQELHANLHPAFGQAPDRQERPVTCC